MSVCQRLCLSSFLRHPGVQRYPPLAGPPAPATLPGLAPDFSFQKEELLLLPVPGLVELVIRGILWTYGDYRRFSIIQTSLCEDTASARRLLSQDIDHAVTVFCSCYRIKLVICDARLDFDLLILSFWDECSSQLYLKGKLSLDCHC